MSASKSNIIIFNPDSWRGDVIAHLGNKAAHTPNLDNFIKNDAASFRNTFCQSQICTPSRCSFMTGWYPHVRGHRTMYHMLQNDEPFLLKILKDKNFYIWWGGKNDVIPAQNGYSKYCDIKYISKNTISPNLHIDTSWRSKHYSDYYYSFYAGLLKSNADGIYYDNDWAMIDGAINFLNEYNINKPFCLYLPLTYPHPPYAVEPKWFELIDSNKMPHRPILSSLKNKPKILSSIIKNQNLVNWGEEQWNQLRNIYYGMCSRVDEQFGLIIKALKKNQLYDSSSIFFFSDHGDFTGDYGLVEKTQNTFEDCLTNVPLLIKPPSSIKIQPGIYEDLVELVDFTSTVYDISSINSNYDLFGKSLMPLITGKKQHHRKYVFCEGGRLYKEFQSIDKDSTSFNNPTGLYYPRIKAQSEENGSHTKATMFRSKKYKYVHRLYENDELYDLENDPHETKNTINIKNQKSIIEEMRYDLLNWYQETCDIVPYKSDKR